MTSRPLVLLIDDEDVLRRELEAYLVANGLSVDSTGDGTDGLRRAREADYDAVVTDLALGRTDGLSVVDEVRRRSADAPVVVITAHWSARSAVEALRRGASDCVTKPIVFEDLLARVMRLVEHRRLAVENRYLRRYLAGRVESEGLVARSPAMKEVLERIRRAGPLESAVLVRGESGTGKEQVARAIHAAGQRREGPFLTLRCGGVPTVLLESALLGHVRGAPARGSEPGEGVIRSARGGTVFLDEVARLPDGVQSKLLRVLDRGQVIPVGGETPVRADARVVAATSADLETGIAEGRFRADLLARLSASSIHVPALRDRREDLPELVDRLICRFNLALGLSVRGIEPEALGMLSSCPWRGNVRELESVVERAMILCRGEILLRGELSFPEAAA